MFSHLWLSEISTNKSLHVTRSYLPGGMQLFGVLMLRTAYTKKTRSMAAVVFLVNGQILGDVLWCIMNYRHCFDQAMVIESNFWTERNTRGFRSPRNSKNLPEELGKDAEAWATLKALHNRSSSSLQQAVHIGWDVGVNWNVMSLDCNTPRKK